MAMALERNYIKSLIEEVEAKEQQIAVLEESIEELTSDAPVPRESEENDFFDIKYDDLLGQFAEQANEVNTLHELNDELEQKINALSKTLKEKNKELNDVKTKMKKPVTYINNINLFEELKNGKLIRFLEPSEENKCSTFKENPFVFELDNKGAIYSKELIGMYEYTDKCVSYYYITKPQNRYIISDILYEIMGVKPEALDCKMKYSRGCGKNVKSLSHNELLKTNPVYNTELNKFESHRHYKFIYIERDGTKYYIKNGIKEIL